jgi:hypothetical protein
MPPAKLGKAVRIIIWSIGPAWAFLKFTTTEATSAAKTIPAPPILGTAVRCNFLGFADSESMPQLLENLAIRMMSRLLPREMRNEIAKEDIYL